MRAFIAAVIVSVVLGAGAAFILNLIQQPSDQRYATQGVRLENQKAVN